MEGGEVPCPTWEVIEVSYYLKGVFGMINENGMERTWIRRGNGNNNCYL